METRSKILISVITSIAVSVVIAVAAFSILKGMNAELRRGQVYDEIIEKTHALNILTASLSQEAEPGDASQIKGILLSLDGLLKGVSSHAPGEEVIVRQLQRNNWELGPLIDQTFLPGPAMAHGLARERRSMLGSQVWMKVRFISDDTNRLKQMSQARMIAAQEKAGFTVLALIVILTLTNGGIYFLSGRSIMGAQEALRESENRLRRFYQSNLLGVIFWNMNGKIVDANDKFLEMVGYDRSDLAAGQIDWLNMTPPEFRHLDEASVEELKATGINRKPLEKEYLRRDGTRLPIMVAGAMLDEERFNGVAFVMDISERKEAEEKLKETAAELQATNTRLEDSRRAAINLLDDALDARQQAEQSAAALHESEERLVAVNSNLTEGLIIADSQGRFINWNPAALAIHGYADMDEVANKLDKLADIFEGWSLEDDHLLSFEDWPLSRVLRGEVLRNYEMRVRRLDQGWEKFAEYSGSLIRSASGELLAFLSITDITERKQAEERLRASLLEKEVMLKEIHHRVKNNLQVISSLVSLQADVTGDETVREVLRDVTYRVRSMALVHEKLYQSSDLARIEFAEYTRSLLNYLWRAHASLAADIRLRLELEPLSLPVDSAVPCGLILNELAGNALKHAFRGRSSGEVSVVLRNTPEGRVSLCLSDNGAGLPAGLDWRQARSLGLRLVQMLAGQLNASVEVNSGEGTRFEITFGISRGGRGENHDLQNGNKE